MATIQVLHLEDNRVDGQLVHHLLKDAGLDVRVTRVQTRNDFTRELSDHTWDVVLADYSLPAFDGCSALTIARRVAPEVPFIFVTGVLGEEVAVDLLKRGATDYVLKSRLERLIPAVTRALEESTARRRLHDTEENLRASEQRLRLLIDSMRDYAIYMISPDRKVVSWNAGATTIFGHSETEAIGLPFVNLFPEQDRMERRDERLLRHAEQTGKVQEQLQLLRKGGASFLADTAITPLQVGRQHRGYCAVTQDVTEQLRAKAEEELHREERARLQEQFLSHVSHELRSPLTTIVDFTSILNEGLGGETVTIEQQQYLKIVLEAANRLTGMVNSLLDLTRTDWRKLPVLPDCLALEPVLAAACHSLASAASDKEISLGYQAPSPAVALVYADALRVTEVVCNLIDNAIKYCGAGAKITVQSECSAADPDFVHVFVSDTGPGIPPEQAKHIFERFYRVSEASGDHPGGLGLGLYISREIVRAHGGDLTLTSSPGRGSSFQFTLPRFSLERCLLPIMSAKNLSKGTLALITVQLPELPNCPSGDFARYLASVREILQRLVYADDDLVLPYINMPGSENRLYVVVFARDEVLPVLLARIREHLGHSLELQPLRGQYEVSVATIDLSNWNLDEAAGAAHRIADALSAMIGLPVGDGGEHVRRQIQSAGGGR